MAQLRRRASTGGARGGSSTSSSNRSDNNQDKEGGAQPLPTVNESRERRQTPLQGLLRTQETIPECDE